MKKLLAVMLASGFAATTVSATDLNLSVESDAGLSSIQVDPSAVVNYRITAILSDDLNEGLALVGLDLVFDGGDLAQADTPAGAIDCFNPMPAFVKPDGITNPAGYGGTVIGGDLIQVGGGQNTIKNTADNADFPIGAVITGVAQPAGCGMAVVATGSLVAPAADGFYTLSLQNAFANVIKDGETGEPFWASEAAGIGTTTSLEIEVTSVACAIASTFPPNCAIDARYPTDAADAGIVFGWDSVDVEFSCTIASLPDTNFSVTSTPAGPVPSISNVSDDGANTVTLALDGPIAPGAWTCFTHDTTGTETCLGFLPGDADGSKAATGTDVLTVIDGLNGAAVPPLEEWQCDIDRSNDCNPTDVLAVIDLLNGSGAFDVWNNEALPACPSAP